MPPGVAGYAGDRVESLMVQTPLATFIIAAYLLNVGELLVGVLLQRHGH